VIYPVIKVTPILTSGALEFVVLSLASVSSGLIKWVDSGATLVNFPDFISLGHLVISWKNQLLRQSPGHLAPSRFPGRHLPSPQKPQSTVLRHSSHFKLAQS
jgi:hypothetical protein